MNVPLFRPSPQDLIAQIRWVSGGAGKVAARVATIVFIGIALVLNSACSRLPGADNLPSIPGLYRLDIQQGNVLDEDKLRQLEEGMTKRKVKFLLGTPAIEDVFRENRWDYVYSLKRGIRKAKPQRVSLYFENDRLVRLDGDTDITLTDVPVPGDRQDRVIDVPRNRTDGTFLGRFRGVFDGDGDEDREEERRQTRHRARPWRQRTGQNEAKTRPRTGAGTR